jgi:hypothetical protein
MRSTLVCARYRLRPLAKVTALLSTTTWLVLSVSSQARSVASPGQFSIWPESTTSLKFLAPGLDGRSYTRTISITPLTGTTNGTQLNKITIRFDGPSGSLAPAYMFGVFFKTDQSKDVVQLDSLLEGDASGPSESKYTPQGPILPLPQKVRSGNQVFQCAKLSTV